MPRIKVNAPAVTGPSPEYLLTVKLLNEFRQSWINQMQESGVSQVLYSRLSVVALTQVAAIAAVDVGMTPEQFVDVCRANFDEALKKAPKFA